MNNLLEWYRLGFKNELDGASIVISKDHRENLAYKLGALHAILGDDVRNFDYLTDEEILTMIGKL